ncbi:MAG TPA: hypothetical protein PLE76_07690 [Rectinema sp.]|jgi:hypothetical protein|nr:hypothetical protein [Rectinema sp.]HOR91879.1 hypothetical protein [Rectinema sp.]HPK79463.1 hypothetical protein [Rectinema sp.]HPN92866.1 hypothetical protein [Rectinema sp.]HQH88313.1 hypothetical protein [Rectinema sp.]
MNNFLFFAIFALGVVATIQYFLGVKKNRWMGKNLSSQAEGILKPKDTDYVNIGGAIGYNFAYKLKEPWKNAKGTFTLFPRHSLLYMPISLVVGNCDRFYMNIFTDKKLVGEGHIIEKRHSRRAKIEGLEEMHKEEIQRAGKTFVLCWRSTNLRDKLIQTLDAMPDASSLTHFCCYSENKTFFLYLKPKKGQISDNLKAFLVQCPTYFRQENPRESNK